MQKALADDPVVLTTLTHLHHGSREYHVWLKRLKLLKNVVLEGAV